MPSEIYAPVQTEDSPEINLKPSQECTILIDVASALFDCLCFLGVILLFTIRFKNPVLQIPEPTIATSSCNCTDASLNFSTSSFTLLSRICGHILPTKNQVQTSSPPTSSNPSQTPSISPSISPNTPYPTYQLQFDWVSMTHIEEFFEATMHTQYPLIISNNHWSVNKKKEWDRFFKQMDDGYTEYYNPMTLWTNNMPWTYLWSTSVLVFKGEDCAHVEGGVPYDAWFDSRKWSPQKTCEMKMWWDSNNHETPRDWKLWYKELPWINGEGSGCCSENVKSEDCLAHLKYRFNKWPYNGAQTKMGKDLLENGSPCCQVLWNQVNAQCSLKNLVGCAADSEKDFDTCIDLKIKYPHIQLFELSRTYVYSDECVKAFEEVQNLPENERLTIPFPCVGDIHLLDL